MVGVLFFIYGACCTVLCINFDPDKCVNCITGRENEAVNGKMECDIYEYMEVISVVLMDPLNYLHPSLQRPAAGCGASLCLPFVMRCHLALLAVQCLCSSPSDTHYEYDNTIAAYSLLIG